MNNYILLPAPSLQEVLEVLPKQIKAKGGIYQTLHIERYSSLVEWSIGYGIEADFVEPNILDAAADLLRWICENYPELLTKTE